MDKVSIIGIGNIGGIIAFELARRGNLELVLLDRSENVAKGKALDINHAMTMLNIDTKILPTSNFEDIANSKVIIITAGVPRKANMTRDDLLAINAQIIKDIGQKIKTYASDAFVIVITNPLDVMTYLLQTESDLNPKKVVGMAGILDSARFKFLLKKHLNISISNISSVILGGHGDEMVPMSSYTQIANLHLNTILSQSQEYNFLDEDLQNFIDKTKNGGREIIELTGNSAYFAPAIASIQMMDSFLFDQRKILPCSVKLSGQYNLFDLYFGAPAMIGQNGVEKIIELPLDSKTEQLIQASAEKVFDLLKKLNSIELENT